MNRCRTSHLNFAALVIFALALGLACSPLAVTGCKTAPSGRVVQYQTLRAVGLASKAAIDTAARLYNQGEITDAQWKKAVNLFDHKFQPAYGIAVRAAQSDYSSLASPELAKLALELTDLIASYTK